MVSLMLRAERQKVYALAGREAHMRDRAAQGLRHVIQPVRCGLRQARCAVDRSLTRVMGSPS